MKAQLGPVLSVAKAAAYAQRLLTLAELRAQLPAADRGAALVTAPRLVVIVDRERESMRRTERRAGL